VDSTARLSSLRLPVGTLLIGAAAGALYWMAPLQALLVYDRAAIGGGELWRLFTGNIVHHSGAHLFCNLTAFLIAGALVEMQDRRQLVQLCLFAGALIGAVLYAARPELIVFGGLSGIVTALAVYLCLAGLDKVGACRWLCLMVLVLLAVKLATEILSGASILLSTGPRDFTPVPESHLVGAAAAALLFLRERLRHETSRVRMISA